MLQRNILRASRSLNTRLPHRTITSPVRSSPFLRSSAVYPSSTRVAARWYSDTAPAKEEAKPDAEKPSENTSNAEVEKLKKDLEAKNKEVVELKDKYLRSIADYRNLQDRTTREVQQNRDFALSKFARDMLPSIDNLTHALNAVPSDRLAAPAPDATPASVHSDLVNLHKGIQLMEEVLLNVLSKHGLTKFDPSVEGEKFDPKVHEAVFQAPMQGKEDGSVFHTQQPGYLLNGRVLRAAQVGVVKNS